MYLLKWKSISKLYILGALLLGLIALPSPWCLDQAAAQTGCPQVAGKTINWIVPRSPGGGYDIYSRLIAPYLEKRLGAKIKIANIPGGGGSIGSKRIADSAPDGYTVGIVGTVGLITKSATGVDQALNPAEDFTILGRVAINQQVLVTSADSKINSISDVFALAQKRPLVFGCTGVAGTSFFNSIMLIDLLGLNAQTAVGYPGSRQYIMALKRGEVDLIVLAYDSAKRHLANGEMRLLLQVSDRPVADDAILRKAPFLCGPDGLAVKRAQKLGLNLKKAEDTANDLMELNQCGRMVVGPAGMEPGLVRCLRDRLFEVFCDQEFIMAAAKARRPLHPADGDKAHKLMANAVSNAAQFSSALKKAIKEARK